MPDGPDSTPAPPAESPRLGAGSACPSCGYALAGLVEAGVCPECGKHYTRERATAPFVRINPFLAGLMLGWPMIVVALLVGLASLGIQQAPLVLGLVLAVPINHFIVSGKLLRHNVPPAHRHRKRWGRLASIGWPVVVALVLNTLAMASGVAVVVLLVLLLGYCLIGGGIR